MTEQEELRLDIDELNKLLQAAVRPRVADLLRAEIKRSELSLNTLSASRAADHASGDVGALQAKTTVVPEKYYKDITSYGWDQSDKFMKIYVSVPDLEGCTKDNVTTKFTEKSFQLQVENLRGKNYRCHVGFLWSKIVPSDSSYKIKTDSILLMLKKAETGKTWAFVTEREGKEETKKKSKFDVSKEEDVDPSANLMNLLKKMYDEGDDEMKRTISKSWSESRNKTDLGSL